MPIDIIIYTFDYRLEGGIVEDFVKSDIVKEYSESDQYAWAVTPVNREQFLELIDEYTRENGLTEDQRGELVGWLDGLQTNSGAFIAIAYRFGGVDDE